MSARVAEQWRTFIDHGMHGPKGFAYILEHRPVVLEGRQPGVRSETQLCTALEIGFAYPDHPMILAFARRSFELADFALREMEGLDVVGAKREHDRCCARRCRSYSTSMLGLGDLDLQLLRGAAEDLQLFIYGGMSESGWDAGAQSESLEAAGLFLLAGQFDQAMEVLSNRKGFRRLKPWHQGLKELAEALSGGSWPVQPRLSDVPQFEELFQQMRPLEEPDWLKGNSTVRPFVQRLELSLMRYLYLTHPNEPISWRRVFEQVAYDSE